MVFGLLISIVIGNLIARIIGNDILINRLLIGQDFYLGHYGFSSAGAQLLFHLDDSLDVIINNHSLTLQWKNIFFSSIAIMLSVMLSTIISSFYLMKFQVKKF